MKKLVLGCFIFFFNIYSVHTINWQNLGQATVWVGGTLNIITVLCVASGLVFKDDTHKYRNLLDIAGVLLGATYLASSYCISKAKEKNT